MATKLTVEYVDVNSVKPYERNAKKHSQEQIEQIKRSIETFGDLDPLGVWHNIIVEGHGRYEALKQLGYAEIPIIRLDHLTDDQRKAYALAHNKLTMNSDFDLDLLNLELADIEIDMEEFGFVPVEDMDLEGMFESEAVAASSEKKYKVIFETTDEQQANNAERILTESGYKCKVI